MIYDLRSAFNQRILLLRTELQLSSHDNGFQKRASFIIKLNAFFLDQGEFQLHGIASTVGINFQTRTVLIDSSAICLQCWDTAGQVGTGKTVFSHV